jgi:hypothetical protein
MNMSYPRFATALLAMLVLASGGALAQEHGHFNGGRPERGERVEHLDARYSHNHYYPSRGGFVRELPGRPVVIDRPGGRYYYSGGVWYAPRGPSFVVVAAPIGLFVPVLPPFYTTVWFGGMPYYYANDTYYAWHDAQNGYEVVEPPGGQTASTDSPPIDDLYFYPQSGQSADQQAGDKYECHKWAVTQSGFDPTQSGGGVPPDQAGGKRADYQRAIRACLEGRGYSVR